MLRNRGLKYRCEHVHVRVEQTDTPFTSAAPAGQVLRIPIGHGEGNYFAPPDMLQRLEANRQVVFRYTDRAGPRRRGGESERIGERDRRPLQRGAQRRRHDAAPRARVRAAARRRRRPRDLRVGDRSRCRRAALARTARRRDAASRTMIDSQVLERHGLKPDEYERIVQFLGREPNLTELGIFSVMWSEHCSYKSSRVHLKTLPTEGPAGAAGARRERRRGRHRRRPGGGLQDRVAQPPVVHRAVPGRGDRRRRHHPRHLHHGRAADRAAELAALRRARRARHAPSARRRGRRHRRLRQQHRHSDGRRRDRVRAVVRRQPAGQRVLPRHRQGVGHHQGRRLRRRQPGLLRRREDRPRRHPRRDDGVGGVRRQVGGEAAGGAGRRSVHGEAAARGVPRGDADRRARRHPGHGRGRADLLDDRDGIARRRRRRDRRRARAAARDRHDAVRDHAVGVAGAHAARRQAGPRGRRSSASSRNGTCTPSASAR